MEETERRKGVNHLCMHWLKTEMASFIYSIYTYMRLLLLLLNVFVELLHLLHISNSIQVN